MPEYKSIKRLKDDAERIRIINKLLKLREQLDRQIPAKTATETLLLATWNIRKFGDNRTKESLHYIAEIMSRFDLIAVQEVAFEFEGLKKVVKLLGDNWDYIVTDSTEGKPADGERMAFIYDRCKISFRKIAGELVLPESRLINVKDEKKGERKLQFARTPYIVAFHAGWFRFVLTTVHIFYGKDKKVDPRRLEEISAVAKFIKKRAKDEKENYILLGDFNIFNTNDETMKALEKQGFYIPDAIKEHPTDLGKTQHYDQIAFKLKMEKDMTVFTEGRQQAGAFDFTQSVYGMDDLDTYREFFGDENTVGRTESEISEYYRLYYRTYQMSDHLPLWIELKVDFSNQYLNGIRQGTAQNKTKKRL